MTPSGVRARLLLGVVLAHGVLFVTVPRALVGQAPGEEVLSGADSVRAFVLERLRQAEAALEAEADSSAVGEVSGDDEAPAREGEGRETARPPELPPGADGIMQELVGLEGFSAASYQGDRAEFDAATRRLVLSGTEESRAFFSGQGVRLEADTSITYEDRAGMVRTQGAADLTSDTNEPLRSELLVYDLRAERGTALGASTTYSEGAQWIVYGDLDSVEQDRLFGSAARFTTCELEDPHSYFQARELKVVGGQILIARSVRMYLDDVPIFWLPFIAQNLGSGRASGILTPTFSINDIVRTSSGYNRRISNLGYYWAMSDYSDLMLAMDWFSENYTALQGGLRYRWARQFLDGTVNVKRYWQTSGQAQFALDTSHRWEQSEQMQLRASGRYVTTADFVRRNSYNPREAVSTVDSDASLNRRFGWGQLTVGSSRKQYLSEEGRTEGTLPSARVSLSTLTLFGAPPQTARWYNNVSVSGSMSWDRRFSGRPAQPDSSFAMRDASEVRTDGSANGSMSFGDLSVRGALRTRDAIFQDVPARFFSPGTDPLADGVAVLPDGRGDFRTGSANWSAGLSYQQRLIGSTTLTPNLSVEGSMMKVDSILEAKEFVAGPRRVRAGLTLQTDIYGFYPGIGNFEAIRHKVTPSLSWAYAPQTLSTDLQSRVFGATVARTQNIVTFGFNQTWEAKLREPEPEPPAPGVDTAAGEAPLPADSTAVAVGDAPPDDVQVPPPAQPDEVPAPPEAGAPDPEAPAEDGLRRLPPSRNVVLLGLQTNALSYDVIEADSTGHFIDGFTTMSVTNRVTSDYLRELNLSFTHELFDDSARREGGAREFSPHLSQLALGFSLDGESRFLQAIGRFLGIQPESEPEPEPEPEPESGTEEEAVPEPGGFGAPLDQFASFDSDRVIPGGDAFGPQREGEGWRADISYSLNRPRDSERGSRLRAQMVQGRLSFAPSPSWTVDWSTSYDVEALRFNDHVVSLIRDLHEWEARFGFVQTATGNWSFQFEVALRANQDLRFDYLQRSGNTGLGGGNRFPAF
ncbi:MAG: putative LPS assembly protein LptD [Gammaproteobacteria bacterium]|nr:putative LPS assembly protein LptD [Gammaproteobacteria bacterium]MDE0248539.1 putative LPS assembly protein LptD [Gammaproteobacteria bacterium]